MHMQMVGKEQHNYANFMVVYTLQIDKSDV